MGEQLIRPNLPECSQYSQDTPRCSTAETETQLSANDRDVLNKIFDYEPSEVEPVLIDSSLPQDNYVAEDKLEVYSRLEQECVNLVEKDQPKEALDILCNIIREEPCYASAYSNRAQLLRSVDFEHNLPKMQAMCDLRTALMLTKPAGKHERVSERNAKILRKIYGQLAAEYMAQSRISSDHENEWDLKLKASEMIMEARKYGEHVPKDTTVVFNPYAKLCGNMMDLVVADALRQCPAWEIEM